MIPTTQVLLYYLMICCILVPSSSRYGQFDQQHMKPSQSHWPAGNNHNKFKKILVDHCLYSDYITGYDLMDSYLVHFSKVKTFKVLQCQVWRQSESIGVEHTQLLYIFQLSVYIFESNQTLMTLEWTRLYLFLISDSLRPNLGASAVRTMALNPALSALLTSCSTTFLFLYTYSEQS